MGLLFGKRIGLRLTPKESRFFFFFFRGRGKSFHMERPKTKKTREATVESLVRELWRLRVSEARAESTGGCVKSKTVTEIRRSSALDTFIAESGYIVLKSLWDWKPVERLKQRGNVVLFSFFFW